MKMNSFPSSKNKSELKKEPSDRDERKKCQNLSVKEKLSILKRLDKEGGSVTRIAHEYGLSDTTLRRWRRKRKQLEKFESECTSTNNKRMKTSINAQLNEALYIWFFQNRKRGGSVSGPILKAKAIDFNELLGKNRNKNFAASDGWLSSWKSRHGIRLPSNSDKCPAAESNPVEDFKIKFAELELGNENLTRSQIFSCAEAILSYKQMPNRSILIKDEEEDAENCQSFSKNTDSFNTMVCSNANGTLKLPLVVIGRQPKPKSLQKMRKEFLPVYYTNDKNLCLNSWIFATWFAEQFVPKVTQFLTENCLPMKAVLLLEHSSSHLSSNSLSIGQIKAIFLPANVTSAIQPMDQKILQNLRMRYKLKLLKSVLNAQDDGVDVVTHLKTLTIRDVIYWMSAAWNEVSGDTIHQSCKELLPDVIEIEVEDSSIQGDKIFHNILNILRRIYGYHESNEEEVKDWIIKEADETFGELSDAQIVQRVLNTANSCDTYDDGASDPGIETPVEETPSITAADALQAIDCVMRFFEHRGIVSPSDLSVFLRAKETLLTDKINTF